ncbi:MAG: IS21 family transposase [Steroidobacteraceae bacterium]
MERHSMRAIREVLRLRHELGLRLRAISAATGMSVSSVSEYLSRAEREGVRWREAAELSNVELERRLFRQVGFNLPPQRAAVDFEWIHRELRRTGVTLQQLWVEYQESVVARGDGARPYQYSQFCDLYASFRGKLAPTMRQVHRAGEKAFLDFSGKKPTIVDRETGEVIEVELFVMVLGASNYTYAEATRRQGLGDFVGATVRGLEHYGCAPQILVPDQLRSAVKRPDRYAPEINPTYAELGQHYGVAIIPARPRKPRDKAKVEAGVLLAQRWILACLRNRTFFSLEELNVAIAELLERLNTRPFQKLEGCRRSAFESIDRPAMKALPAQRYQVAEWKWATVNIDYHVMHHDRPYSVPHTLVNAAVEVRATAMTVEIFHDQERVAAHARCYGPKGTPTTLEQHRPKSHRDWGAWPPSRLVSWAGSIGPNTASVVEQILQSRPHPEQGFRSCLGLIRSAKKYGNDRVEAACTRALAIGAPTRKSVLAILASGLDRVPFAPAANKTNDSVVVHENIRGGDYFDKEEAW